MSGARSERSEPRSDRSVGMSGARSERSGDTAETTRMVGSAVDMPGIPTIPVVSTVEEAARASRVLVLWCPDWPVVAVGVEPDEPAVVVERGQIVAATEAARGLGVRRGQRIRDAQRRCPGLVMLDADPAAEVRCFEQVVALVEERCPRVEVVRPGLAALSVRGPARYFGSEQAVADAIRVTVADQGYVCATGVADGTFAATLAARQPPEGIVIPPGRTPEYLAPQSVSVLDRPALATVLTRLGIRTLGAFAALPEGDVLTRFGPDGAQAHRLAGGRSARPPATGLPPEDLSVAVTFDPPRDAEPVVFAARGLAERLHVGLAMHGLACEQVAIEVVTEDGRSRSRLWRHAGLLSAAAVAERVRWQLDAWRAGGSSDGATPGGAVTVLRLLPDQLVPGDGQQGALWGRSALDERVDRAVTRIQAMLGHTAVARPLLAGGRGPGERVLRVPWGDHAEPPRPAARPWPGQLPTPAPAVVLPDPVPVGVLDETGQAVTVSARCTVSAPPAAITGLPGAGSGPAAVRSWTGPWPAHEQWWAPGAGRRLVRFQMTTQDGRAWLLLVEAGRWLVEAGYD